MTRHCRRLCLTFHHTAAIARTVRHPAHLSLSLEVFALRRLAWIASNCRHQEDGLRVARAPQHMCARTARTNCQTVAVRLRGCARGIRLAPSDAATGKLHSTIGGTGW
eukprot:15471202-Alexandrium_andersonii.AAC.1